MDYSNKEALPLPKLDELIPLLEQMARRQEERLKEERANVERARSEKRVTEQYVIDNDTMREAREAHQRLDERLTAFTQKLEGYIEEDRQRRLGTKSKEESRMSLDATVNAGFIKAFRNYSYRVNQWAAPLDEKQFWSKPYPYGNSFGHLVLHLTGNLNYYIGAQIAQTGYVRHRDLEFTDPNPPSKAEALARFDATIEMVIATVEKQTAEDWAAPYEATGMPEGASRFDAVMQCAAHIFHHQGQMIYLQKEWTK